MGTSASKEPPPTVICVGLDAAGKTTLLYKIKENGGGQVETTIPTIGAHSSHAACEKEVGCRAFLAAFLSLA